MNKQGNTYTIIYIVILVLVVGAALAATSIALRPRQQANADADKMRQILLSARVSTTPDDVIATFHELVDEQFVVNSRGERVEGDAFAVNVAEQSKLPEAERMLPVFVCKTPDGAARKYIVPVYGAGLWGPIWGYVAVDADGSTVYGAYFAHQGETPGLGAEIEKPAFSDQFEGKVLFKNGRFLPVAVVKAGQKPMGDEDYVDGISGGTITSKGVGAMLANCLAPYETFFSNLKD
ncbi:MAG: NADH:ubiquinone reductase (Na(+)-transporting) subunit C [Muribaculaceae bacterium]|nr:NADH:ubiquinone reductase (Na(+)-transporting) subunit C [Muribaculaceae bacterium]